MPQIDFDEGYKKKGLFDYDKLTLEQNEKARVCVLDSPIMEYVHTLRKVITENGEPVMEMQKYGRNFEKEREVPKTDFVGKYICHGDLDVLNAKGVDPDNCPGCKAAAENGAAVEVAKRRFVVHVLKYETKKNSFNLQEPFSAKLLAWEFAESRFSTLVDIRTEHGKLNGLDLILGPCTNKNFQKYDVLPGASAEWAASPERKKITSEIVQSQRAEDLSPLLGRKVEPHELRAQVQDVVNTYNRAFGRPGELPADAVNTNAGDDISDLLNESTPEPKTEAAPAASQEELDLSGLDEFAQKSPESSNGAEDKKEEPKKTEVEDLDALLADI